MDQVIRKSVLEIINKAIIYLTVDIYFQTINLYTSGFC